MRVMKFGGSSVATAKCIKQVIGIVKEAWKREHALVVVVSALGGVTDELIKISHLAANAKNYQHELELLKKRHLETAHELISTEKLPEIAHSVEEHFKELGDTLHGVSLIKELSKRSLDLIMSFGERLSASIIAAAIDGEYIDARALIKTNANFGAAQVNYNETNAKISEQLTNKKKIPIVTGFIASTDKGETTTLGRGGSDYTAAIIGAALHATEIEIWTDVDGVMTADPRKVPLAFPLANMTYKEALEMSHFGAKVLHPPTIAPALRLDIPIRIKNTFRPEAEGTLITKEQNKKNHEYKISGISSIDHIALLRLEGSGLVGVAGISKRLFGTLAQKEISVILISQASSEHSICFAIAPQHAQEAKEILELEFALEQRAGLVDPIVVEKDLSIVAIVGENMRRAIGISGTLFSALGKNGINVVAIAQGSSEYNISVVIRKSDEKKALNVIHEAFFLSPYVTLNLFVVGVGLVGKTLLKQITSQLKTLQNEHALDLKLIGLANSKNMHFDVSGIPLESWERLLHDSLEKMNIHSYAQRIKELNLPNSVFIDCTSDEAIAENYADLLKSNISIVTPNKKANSGSYDRYVALKEIRKKSGALFLYETNVGAGLPIIGTINDLIRSGDKIIKIEAILSGTLSFLFNRFAQGGSFSGALREAQSKGFTEPDPRDDLNGMDVKRKLLILARESGYKLELDDVALELIVPQEIFKASSVAEFYSKLENHDSHFEELRSKIKKEGKVLRYIASLDKGKCKISLQSVDVSHPFYHMSGSDNIIAITTERYKDTPIVIKGQGAGAEVTAGEIFAEIIRVGKG